MSCEPVKTENRKRWCGVGIDKRLEDFCQIYVELDEIVRIINAIERHLRLNKPKKKSSGILVLAESGCGKSALISHLKKLYPDEETETASLRRVVEFEIPSPVTTKGMRDNLLLAQGDPLWEVGTSTQKKVRSHKYFKECDTKILAIDNFHDIPEHRGSEGIKELGNWVRNICEGSFGGVVLALGTEEAKVVRDSNVQLRRRMPTVLRISSFSIANELDAVRTLKCLREIDDRLPLGESSNLSDKQMVALLMIATEGIFDYLMKLLASAMVRAVERGSEKLELTDLRLGFVDQHGEVADEENPFSPNFNGNRLIGPGQVFFNSVDRSTATSKTLANKVRNARRA